MLFRSDPAYVHSIVQRSEKIIDKLNLEDKSLYNDAVNILANRYFELNDIYANRDQAIAKAKEVFTGSEKELAIKKAQSEADAALYKSHFAFPANLSLLLNQSQIEAVKNGMTYNVLNLTHAAYLDMIPTLAEEEKIQIYAWLQEAREFAIDAENSKKKHETFGKYNGRINNYLSARGYNLTEQREEWGKRVEARGDTL